MVRVLIIILTGLFKKQQSSSPYSRNKDKDKDKDNDKDKDICLLCFSIHHINKINLNQFTSIYIDLN